MLSQPEPITHFDPVSHDLLAATVQRHCAVLDCSTEVRLDLPLHSAATMHLRRFEFTKDRSIDKGTSGHSKSAINKRSQEFEVGRFCARHALKQLQPALDTEIPADTDRKPIWPPEIVGSISHSHHYAWAVSAKKENISSIGIDTEIIVNGRTFQQVVNEITVEAEQELFSKVHHDIETAFTILFSAKESIYKCLYPRNEQFFGFHDVLLIAAQDQSVTFAQQPSNPNFSSAPQKLTVQYAVVDNDVFTSIWV